MSYNDCKHGAEMCDTCLDIMSDGIKQGAEEERARIIALLEKLTWTRNCLYTETIDCTLCRINVHDAIAQIKEDNK